MGKNQDPQIDLFSAAVVYFNINTGVLAGSDWFDNSSSLWGNLLVDTSAARSSPSTTKRQVTASIFPAGSTNSKKAQWAVSLFHDWRETTNQPVPEITDMTEKQLDLYLANFFNEIRTQKGLKYTPKTLQTIAQGIAQYLDDERLPGKDFLTRDSSKFPQSTKVLISKGVFIKSKPSFDSNSDSNGPAL